MKNFGFTLAEVLITLGIIGIISALTIPTLVSDSENRAHAAKLSSTITSVEDAFASMMASDAVQDFAETTFYRADSAADRAANLGLHIKLSGSASSFDNYYGDDTEITTLDNESLLPNFDMIFQLKNGALLFYYEDPDSINRRAAEDEGLAINERVGTLAIDVNGGEGPNRWGRDFFQFLIGSDGMLYPAGSLTYAMLIGSTANDIWSESGAYTECIPGGSRTQGCTARLIENNYKIDY